MNGTINNPHRRLRRALAEIEEANGEHSAQWALVRVYDMWFEQVCPHPEFETITRTEEEAPEFQGTHTTEICARCRETVPRGPAWF